MARNRFMSRPTTPSRDAQTGATSLRAALQAAQQALVHRHVDVADGAAERMEDAEALLEVHAGEPAVAGGGEGAAVDRVGEAERARVLGGALEERDRLGAAGDGVARPA